MTLPTSFLVTQARSAVGLLSQDAALAGPPLQTTGEKQTFVERKGITLCSGARIETPVILR